MIHGIGVFGCPRTAPARGCGRRRGRATGRGRGRGGRRSDESDRRSRRGLPRRDPRSPAVRLRARARAPLARRPTRVRGRPGRHQDRAGRHGPCGPARSTAARSRRAVGPGLRPGTAGGGIGARRSASRRPDSRRRPERRVGARAAGGRSRSPATALGCARAARGGAAGGPDARPRRARASLRPPRQPARSRRDRRGRGRLAREGPSDRDEPGHHVGRSRRTQRARVVGLGGHRAEAALRRRDRRGTGARRPDRRLPAARSGADPGSRAQDRLRRLVAVARERRGDGSARGGEPADRSGRARAARHRRGPRGPRGRLARRGVRVPA